MVLRTNLHTVQFAITVELLYEAIARQVHIFVLHVPSCSLYWNMATHLTCILDQCFKEYRYANQCQSVDWHLALGGPRRIGKPLGTGPYLGKHYPSQGSTVLLQSGKHFTILVRKALYSALPIQTYTMNRLLPTLLCRIPTDI